MSRPAPVLFVRVPGLLVMAHMFRIPGRKIKHMHLNGQRAAITRISTLQSLNSKSVP